MSIYEKIPKNQLLLFKTSKVRKADRKSKKIENLKHDCSLFSRLYITSQTAGRELSMEEFFSHENQRYPPSLSDNGSLNGGTKSDLLKSFEDLSKPLDKIPACGYVKVDGMVMMNKLIPKPTQKIPKENT